MCNFVVISWMILWFFFVVAAIVERFSFQPLILLLLFVYVFFLLRSLLFVVVSYLPHCADLPLFSSILPSLNGEYLARKLRISVHISHGFHLAVGWWVFCTRFCSRFLCLTRFISVFFFLRCISTILSMGCCWWFVLVFLWFCCCWCCFAATASGAGAGAGAASCLVCFELFVLFFLVLFCFCCIKLPVFRVPIFSSSALSLSHTLSLVLYSRSQNLHFKCMNERTK